MWTACLSSPREAAKQRSWKLCGTQPELIGGIGRKEITGKIYISPDLPNIDIQMDPFVRETLAL